MRKFLLLFGMGILCALALITGCSLDEPWSYHDGGYQQNASWVTKGNAIAVNPSDGTIYQLTTTVGEFTQYHEVKAFSRSGDELQTIRLSSLVDRKTIRELAYSNNALYLLNYNNVYVTDMSGSILRSWSTNGQPSGANGIAMSIALDQHGNVYIAHMDDHCVRKYANDGTYITEWGTNYLIHPMAIAVDKNNMVYVADNTNSKIFKFATDGQFIGELGGYGTTPGCFFNPQAIGIGPNNHVFVADAGNYRVQEFDANGQLVTWWGQKGYPRDNSQGLMAAPFHIGIDDSLSITVADSNNRVSTFSKKTIQ